MEQNGSHIVDENFICLKVTYMEHMRIGSNTVFHVAPMHMHIYFLTSGVTL